MTVRRLAFIVLVMATAAGLSGCNSDNKPSYEALQTENEELHAKLSAALEHVEEAENDLKSEIAKAEGNASAYRICEDAEDAITNADSYADEIQSSLDDAKNELE